MRACVHACVDSSWKRAASKRVVLMYIFEKSEKVRVIEERVASVCVACEKVPAVAVTTRRLHRGGLALGWRRRKSEGKDYTESSHQHWTLDYEWNAFRRRRG